MPVLTRRRGGGEEKVLEHWGETKYHNFNYYSSNHRSPRRRAQDYTTSSLKQKVDWITAIDRVVYWYNEGMGYCA